MGASRSQTLNTSFTGTLMGIPKRLSLITAQRHTTASTSTRPPMMEQQDLACGEPTLTSPCNMLAQALKSGQFGRGDGETICALTELRLVKKKKMLRKRMRMLMNAKPFEPILQ